MNEIPKTKSGWRILRRILIGCAVLATLTAIFYTEENWRGKRAWESCKRELEAKGTVLDWSAYIPPPVPDDQNFFKATTNITPWFVKSQTDAESELARKLNFFNGLPYNTNTTVTITNEAVARDYLAWSDQFQPQFDELREALKRPYARMEGDYTQPFDGPRIPNFVTMRSVAQTLAQRGKCYLILGEPEKTLRDLTLLHDLSHILTERPNTLVATMIDSAVTGLYLGVIADGMQRHAWREPELAVIQGQLRQIDLQPLLVKSTRWEMASVCHGFEIYDAAKFVKSWFPGKPSLWKKLHEPLYLLLKFAPRGWVYQSMIDYCSFGQRAIDFNGGTGRSFFIPSEIHSFGLDVEKSCSRFSPFKFLSAISIPAYQKATQALAYNQTLANEAQIACALERYHLAHGEYPETLDALAPQFIEKIPHDIIGGEPLHYRRTADGKFLLYSFGWNEKDDGGVVGKDKSGNEDRTQGDWVWQYPVK